MGQVQSLRKKQRPKRGPSFSGREGTCKQQRNPGLSKLEPRVASVDAAEAESNAESTQRGPPASKPPFPETAGSDVIPEAASDNGDSAAGAPDEQRRGRTRNAPRGTVQVLPRVHPRARRPTSAVMPRCRLPRPKRPLLLPTSARTSPARWAERRRRGMCGRTSPSQPLVGEGFCVWFSCLVLVPYPSVS